LNGAGRAEQAKSLGFEYEKTYHGCGQSVIAAVTETLGIFDETCSNPPPACAAASGW
jgi:hypothetical protein